VKTAPLTILDALVEAGAKVVKYYCTARMPKAVNAVVELVPLYAAWNMKEL
jgi:hypothetical protein